MNCIDAYKSIIKIVNVGFRCGARKCGPKSGDLQYDLFLQKTRIFKDALMRFSLADRKLWLMQVGACNQDLIAHSKRVSTDARIASWKKTCKGRVPNRQVEQIAEKRKRLEAVEEILRELKAKKLKPTAKVVSKRLSESYKHLTTVETDTLRKELSFLKAARQSSG
jgi:hypothetical protein